MSRGCANAQLLASTCPWRIVASALLPSPSYSSVPSWWSPIRNLAARAFRKGSFWTLETWHVRGSLEMRVMLGTNKQILYN